MKQLIAISMVALSTPAMALECRQDRGIYEQSGGQVVLHFSEVPRDAAANQIAAFSIDIANVEADYSGGIFIPNGFGQPHGSIGRNCTEDAAAPCEFWDGVVYALGEDGIEEFPWDPDRPREEQIAPQQVLLPGFAANVWYSMERPQVFEGERMVLDVFSLAACTRQANMTFGERQ